MRPSISRAEMCAIIRSLGADPEQVVSIECDVKAVTVVSYALDGRGQRHVKGGVQWAKPGDPPPEVATETTVIPVVGDMRRDTVPMRHPDLPGRVIDVRPRGVGQRAMAGWEVVAPAAPETDPPPKKDPPPESGSKPEAPAEPGASSSPPPRGRRPVRKKEDGR